MGRGNHLNSPLWQLWREHLYEGLGYNRLSEEEWAEWLDRKTKEWYEMKANGVIDVKKLSIAKPYKYKSGRKRGRRKKK